MNGEDTQECEVKFKEFQHAIVSLLLVKNSLTEFESIFESNGKQLRNDTSLLDEVFSKLNTCSEGFVKRLKALKN